MPDPLWQRFADPQVLWLLLLVPAVLALRMRGGVPESRMRRILGSMLRAVAVAALVVAVAGPLASGYSRAVDVVFAVDVSASVGRESVRQALDFVNRARAAKPSGARTGLVAFGSDAQVEALLRADAEPLGAIAADVGRSGTDIGRAIQVALGSFSSGGQRRVVLLSDGRENLGDARAAAAVAGSVGVEIVSMPLERRPAPGEVSLQALTAPARVNVHEPFRLRVVVDSRSAGRAHLLVLRDGALLGDVMLDLAPGANVRTFVEEVGRAGLHEYEAVVNSDADGEQENNRLGAFVQVDGPPKVLHAAGRGEEARHVSAALRAQGLQVDQVSGSAVPGSMQALADYDLVILDNVSGFDLSLAKMGLLEAYVRDAGGGLIKLGGDRSYGAGGYYDTPVERLLPVTMDVQTTVRIPSLAVIFVLDRSGSMGSRSQGEEKITIARNAALASIDLLNRLDRVGVLAFDDTQEWIVPPTEVGDRRPITAKLGAVGAGGSTDLVRALEEAHRVMREQQAKVKHLIVLSDGLAGSDVSFDAFAERIRADAITVSTVALGVDADRALMARLAALGQGRYYYTDDARNVPRIFSSETMVVARNLVVERTTRALPGAAGEPTRGFEPQDFPPLHGYQRAFPKPAAQVLLETEAREPLLVSWRYGLGRSLAFTSDLTTRWGRDWVRWPQFTRFVSQMARWSMRRGGNETLRPSFRRQGQRAEVVVDALDRDERFVNGLDMAASVSGPDRGTRRLALEQVAPGRYRGEFPVPVSGRYFVNLSGTRGDLRVGPRTFGLAVPYASEYLDLGADHTLLADLARASGGAVLPMRPASLPAILARGPDAARHAWRVWRPFLLVALLALVLEVAVRKVVWPRGGSWTGNGNEAAVTDDDGGYRELRRRVERGRDAHLQALRDGAVHAAGDPAARARLYGARARH